MEAIGCLGKSHILTLSWQAAVSVATSARFRKAEMFRSNEETFYLTWDLVSWSIGGRVVPWDDATEELLAGLKVGDFAIITPPPSKADQFNQVWGALPMYIPFHSKDRNAAGTL